MSHSSILGADRVPLQAKGRDSGALGPSDSSDTGSDVWGVSDQEEGEQPLGDLHTPYRPDTLHESMLSADSDEAGTGERATAIPGEWVREAGDISPDRVTSSFADVDADDEETLREYSQDAVIDESDDDEE